MDCLFCKITNKEMKSAMIYEDEAALAFLDVNPLTRGHALVVPKNHARSVLDLPDGEIGAVFGVVKKVTKMLNRALNPAGFTIGINHGRISGQTVDHLHIHVIPRYPGDGGGSIHSVVKHPPEENIEETKKKIIEVNDGN